MQTKYWRKVLLVLVCGLAATCANGAFFEDEEARKAILELRQRVEALRLEAEQYKLTAAASAASSAAEIAVENANSGKNLLELQRKLELMRSEVATLRGANEQLAKELTDLQRLQKDQLQVLLERLSKLEPVRVNLDGVDFQAEPGEKKEFESALKVFRGGDFAASQNLFVGFIGRYPLSGYATPALFWLGNAQYATRDYKEAIINFRALIARTPEHMRAAESLLSIANCQLELKDVRSARKTLTDLIGAYPQSEASVAAKERLSALK